MGSGGWERWDGRERGSRGTLVQDEGEQGGSFVGSVRPQAGQEQRECPLDTFRDSSSCQGLGATSGRGFGGRQLQPGGVGCWGHPGPCVGAGFGAWGTPGAAPELSSSSANPQLPEEALEVGKGLEGPNEEGLRALGAISWSRGD